MAKLYYGSGNCTIEGDNIIGVEIRYEGAIKLTDKTNSQFAIGHKNNGIIIFPIAIGESTLNNLFDYIGNFKIKSLIVVNKDAEVVETTYHKVMDYAELLNSTPETMTIKSEDLKAGHRTGRVISKSSSTKNIIPNMNTNTHDGTLYLSNGDVYKGLFHVHLTNNAAMTGSHHSPGSKNLYTKQVYDGEVIDKLISTNMENPKKLKVKKSRRIMVKSAKRSRNIAIQNKMKRRGY